MNKFCKCVSRARFAFCKIHLVDKFLIVFMLILLLQAAYNLFVNHTSVGEAGNIDVIVRTSIAAIFGYFLSTNFIRSATSALSEENVTQGMITAGREITKDILPQSSEGIQSRIGFSDTESTGAELEAPKNASIADASRLQVVTASALGLFCLTVLLILRNVTELGNDMTATASTTATIAQFRDIVSGCIGFLIGCPTSAKK